MKHLTHRVTNQVLSLGRVVVIGLSPVLILAGCATMSKEECVVANWEAIGFSDGAKGYGGDRLSSHSKACAKASVAPDYTAWERGRQQGLKQYCTESNAYQLGKSGRNLNSVCPPNTTSILQRINADGREVYNLTQQIQNDTRQLEKYQDELKSLREGSNLEFKTEAEARAYLLSLPTKIRRSEENINDAQLRLVELRRLYGY